MSLREFLPNLGPFLKVRSSSDDFNPLVTSLGLAVIDTIKFGSGTIENNVLGGSGSVGALLFLSESPRSVAFKILAGSDFPKTIETKLREWAIDLTIDKNPSWSSVRGFLEYLDTSFGPKTFRYTTPVLQVAPKDLKDTAALSASAFHFLCHPNKVKDTVTGLLHHRGSLDRPLLVWEPAPPACTSENLNPCLETVRFVDIFSPNHLELLRLCNRDDEAFSRSLIEDCVDMFLRVGIGPSKTGIAVIRAGEYGCMIKTGNGSPAEWLPPYYSSEQSDKIVDTTGAGNAFLGGFIVGFLETKSEIEAACYGTVAASYMLEQLGTPRLVKSDDGIAYWNNENPMERLKMFKSRYRPR